MGMEAPTPENQKAQGITDTFLAQALDRMRVASDADGHNRSAYADDINFYLNEQWDIGQKTDRDRDGRPSLVINVLPTFVEQVIGDLRLNRPRIKVRPEGSGASVQIAKIIDGLIRHIEYESNAEVIYDSGGETAVIGGYGAWRVDTDYLPGQFEQQILIRPITDPMSVYFEPRPFDLDTEHANWAFVTFWLTKKEFSAKYKVEARSIPNVGKGDQAGWYDQGKVKLAEYWVRTPVRRKLCLLSNGDVLPEDKAQEAIEASKATSLSVKATTDELVKTAGINVPSEMEPLPTLEILKSREEDTYKVERYIICGSKVLEGPEEFPGTIIPIIMVYGKQVIAKGKKHIRGMVRNAKDAQRKLNYTRSSEIEVLSLQPKVSWIATPEQIEGHEEDFNMAHKKGLSVVTYNHVEGQDPPTRVPPVQSSPGFYQGSQEALIDLKMTLGLQNDNLGLPTGRKSSKAIRDTQREGDVGNYSYYDNFVRALKLTGKIIVGIIPEVYDTERSFSVKGFDGKEQQVNLNQPAIDNQGLPAILNDVTKGKYGVIIDTGPSYTTARVEAAEQMIEFAGRFPQAANLIQDLVARTMDWPLAQEIADRLEKALPPQISGKPSNMPPPPQVQAQMQKFASQASIAQSKAIREKIKILADTLKLQEKKKDSSSDMRKLVLDVLSSLYSEDHPADKFLSGQPKEGQ